MSRTTTLLLILPLLLCSTPSYTARHMAADTTKMVKHQDKDGVKTTEIEESCEGIIEVECLMRRTLTAHIDYIYGEDYIKEKQN
nr:hypothetical protein [Tanacetum cinerariifolium]